MTRAARRRAHTVGLVLLAALVGALASNIVTTADRQSVLPDGIVLCEVTDEIARCEMIAGAEER